MTTFNSLLECCFAVPIRLVGADSSHPGNIFTTYSRPFQAVHQVEFGRIYLACQGKLRPVQEAISSLPRTRSEQPAREVFGRAYLVRRG